MAGTGRAQSGNDSRVAGIGWARRRGPRWRANDGDTPCSRPTAFPTSTPLHAAATDYDVVRRAIGFISEHWRQQPEIEAIAHAVGITATELHHLFRRWSGLTPKAFLQAITLDRARTLLRDSASVLDAAYDVGLSGPGRLHDLFVTHEAMSPGEWKAGGEGLTLHYGFHPSPFGIALIIAAPRGLAGLAFADPRRGAGGARRHAAPLAEGALCRGRRAHRAARPPHLRSRAVARRPAAARRADRHRLGGAGLGDAAENPDGPRHDLFRHRPQGRQRRRPRARSAPPSARTRSRSWCRATACSARAASSPATTGASRASARCWAGKRANRRGMTLADRRPDRRRPPPD